jgi:hypothetical protein
MKPVYLSILLAFCSPIVVYATDDFASQMSSITQSAVAQVGKQMAVKINLSGKQRMLIQKMSKEAVFASLGINTEQNKKNLSSSIALFEETLAGLQNGNSQLALSKTDDQEIGAQLDKVQQLWNEFKPNLEKIISNGDDKAALANIAQMNLPLLFAMDKVVASYAQNSGSNLSDLATVLNLSGKQRMLTQKMTKELSLVAKGLDESENRVKLHTTMQLFDQTLKGLLKGDKDLDLPETTDDVIRKQLTVVQGYWNDLKPLIEAVDTSNQSLQKVGQLNLTVLHEMDKAVKMYENQSKSL